MRKDCEAHESPLRCWFYLDKIYLSQNMTMILQTQSLVLLSFSFRATATGESFSAGLMIKFLLHGCIVILLFETSNECQSRWSQGSETWATFLYFEYRAGRWICFWRHFWHNYRATLRFNSSFHSLIMHSHVYLPVAPVQTRIAMVGDLFGYTSDWPKLAKT